MICIFMVLGSLIICNVQIALHLCTFQMSEYNNELMNDLN